MAITFYCGLPGKGKTAFSTHLAIKTYKQDNGIIRTLIKRKRGVVIYSNYPILLDKKREIYSNRLSVNMLQMNYKFPDHAVLIVDEAQKYYDAREFSKFPKEMGTFLQHHRHANIREVIWVSQHPRRLDNKQRDLSEVFRKYRLFLTIPFFPIGLCLYSNYYEFDDYGKYHKTPREMRNFDVDNHIRLFFKKNIFGHYYSKYYDVVFNDLEPVPSIPWTSLKMTKDDVNAVDEGFISVKKK